MSTEALIYQLKITLLGTKPAIWRRVLVPNSISLAALHKVVQIAMGWTDSHLHTFHANQVYFAPPDPYNDVESINSAKVRIDAVLMAVKDKLQYDYDFGDGWEHTIVVEKILPASEGPPAALCAAGKGACPPEDCGGPWGYADLRKIIASPAHPEHESTLEWLGDDYDPHYLDLVSINSELARLKFKSAPAKKRAK